ncbi:fatty acid oxidation complex subunit alpha FadB [Motilimonas pumila]|uniref:enoyl-CoA hydratase n=1 Tax=Motilimonas pumila TaxID=2303987 RepID=A0A418YBM3_9GAMM|nr:fatty acid oxidation complex subunit alpha FadB [Motilimonas pumila]RJG41903.1 fatty acid oxidation complex subunit alpha FadB [Motilimonas pumila]
MLYQSDTLTLMQLDDGIAEIRFGNLGSVNKFDRCTLVSFQQALAILQDLSGLTGLILSHNKKDFMVGADINEFLPKFALPDEELSQWLHQANQIFNSLEDLPVPTISVMGGFVLGGGCECVLATDFRISDSSLKIGLPEVKLGIMPGFGGSVRLPRLIGADNALMWITTGKHHHAEQALKDGVLDAIVATEHRHQAAVKMLQQANQLGWQQRRAAKKAPLCLSNIEATMCFSTANAMVAAKAGPHYPAPVTAVTAMQQAAGMSRDEALAIENQHFVRLAKTHVARALVGIYLNDQQLKQSAKKLTANSQKVQSLAVLGAGIMGGGIAYQGASKRLNVVMKDIQPDALHLGMSEANTLLNKQIKRGKLTSHQLGETLARITPSLNYDSVKNAQVVIEAVVENPKIKAQVLAETEQHIGVDSVLVSNTSTIPIGLLAQSLARPEQFCGMHFFNPVHRMPLVEVIRGPETSQACVEQVVALAIQLGKSPVVVNDCPGFFVNRVLFPYFFGFARLIAAGVDFAHIDRVMEQQFGWPMGPAYLLDVVGIDTAHHAGAVMAQGYPTRMQPQQDSCIDLFFEAQKYGQKSGEGFYQYHLDSKGRPAKKRSDAAYELLAQHFSSDASLSDDTIIDYLMVPLVNEVLHCLDEQIVASAAEADIALVYGLGFPPFRGGPIAWLQHIGLDQFIAKADALAALGPLYQVPASLRERAASGTDFY